MTYARARLFTGISGVGTMVLLSALALFFDVPGIWPHPGRGLEGDFLYLAEIALLYVLLSLPLDWVGGWWVPCHFERICFSFPVYVVKWFRGVVLQAIALVGLGTLLLLAGRAFGIPGAVAALAALSIALLALQFPLARLLGGLRIAPSQTLPFPVPAGTSVVIVDPTDPGFSGGIVGLPGAARIVIPSHWLRLLPPAVVEAAVQRRIAAIRSGSRTRGLAVAMAWNLAGFLLCASLLPGASVATAAGLFRIALGCTLWTFLGLLILPSLSRPGVSEADHVALQSGVLIENLTLAIRELDQLQEDEPHRPSVVETIFHPIPSVDNRLASLLDPAHPFGAWHATRTTLFLSWTSFGFLSRAVHCNSGRPELWVLLPAD